MNEPWTAAQVEAELQAAGRVLRALGVAGVWPAGVRSAMPEVVREACEGYGWDGARVRPARPGPGEIAAMDRAFGWLRLIPDDCRVLRRIVAARSLTHAGTGRPLYSWRRIAGLVGASHMAVSRWHGQGLAIIAQALSQPSVRGPQSAASRTGNLPR